MAIAIISPQDADYHGRIESLLGLLRSGTLTAADTATDLDVPAIVADIIAQVRDQGDAAVCALTNRLDRAAITPQTLRVSAADLASAHASADPALMTVLRAARDNIQAYQEHIRHRDPEPLRRGGRTLGLRYTPMQRAAIYVPGGRALYPSTVLMTAVPALVAGVEEIVMVSPPSGGEIAPLALALAHELGIREVYRCGGAVAIAALALGTATIPVVDKIVGPGNAFVAEAKRQLFGRVGIDAIAGPSEVVIVADAEADPACIAADLLAQAEHDPGSAVLITPAPALATAVADELARRLAGLERAAAIAAALERYGAIIVTPDLTSACALADRFATEHLELHTADDAACLTRIRHAGAIFLGRYSPVSLGDYYAGPSHVLPTGGTARFFGPLSANDFLKASSTIHYDAAALAEDGPGVQAFAAYEGLTAHGAAVAARHPSP